MKRKTIQYSFITVILIGIGLIYFAGSEYNRKHNGVDELSSAFTLNSGDLIDAFSKNEKAANEKYLDKVMTIWGTVKSIDKDDQGAFTLVLGEPNTMSSVRCSIDSNHNEEASNLTAGVKITVKGICTGFNADELLGSDVILNRSIPGK
jgi:hypothetical protein